MKIVSGALWMWLAAASGAWAQDLANRTVVVTAAGKVDKLPTALQFTFRLSAKGDDVAKAAEALEARRKAAVEQLRGLGVAEADLVVGCPGVLRKDPNQARVMRMSRGMNRLKKKKDDEKPEKEPVAVELSLTARLPLSAKDPAALFVESEELKEKIKAAKLLPKEKKETGEGDEDEEMAAQMAQYQEQQGMEDGFVFLFRAPSDPKDIEAAAAKALKSAQELAQATAQAAGKTVGAPLSVEIAESGGGAAQMEYYNYYNAMQRRRMGMPGSGGDASEVLGGSPDALQVSVGLKVTFLLTSKP